MTRIVVALAVPILVAAGMALWYTSKKYQNGVQPPFSQKEIISFAELALAPSPSAFSTGLEQLPASLQGTEVDGTLLADDKGNLVINADIRRVFDYFLSTLGSESLEEIEQRLRSYMQHQLPVTAAQQAEQLLEQYLALNAALLTLESSVESEPSNQLQTDALRERLLAIQSLRHEYLPADVIDAFYADDDALDQLALGRIDIMQDSTLTAAQRTQALADLEQSLPPHLQRVMSELNKQTQLSALTTRLRNSGGSAADLYQLRESFYGPRAAERLAQLDQSRQQWQARMDTWLRDRNSMMSAQGLDNADRQQLIDRMRRDHFQPAELPRVEILERIHDNAP